MRDPRYRKLAQLLLDHSTSIKKGENILIEAFHIPSPMIEVLVEEAISRGACPYVERRDNAVLRKMLSHPDLEVVEQNLKRYGELDAHRMDKMDAYIGLRGAPNITELADVPPEAMALYETHWQKPVHHEIRVPRTKWVVLRWPTPSMAQQAGQSTESFEDFYFQVCLTDYAKMSQAVKPLEELMNRTDKVRIKSPGTDLTMSIKGLNSIPCCGQMNIPDGECFTAPVRDSVEGTIQFNTPTIYRGVPFDNIKLTFKEGKVVDFDCNNNEALQKILDSDEGARYLGEFAIGFHPHIHEAMRDILFDEKIGGSLHMALGNAYQEANNGNQSNIHWDLVLLQAQGGEIYFDEVLIRKDGIFLLPELEGLNPKNLS